MKSTNCQFCFNSVQEKGDPEEFDENTKEWLISLAEVFDNILELPVRPKLTFDKDHYNQYVTKSAKAKGKSYAACLTQAGLIFINPKLHVTDPKIQMINSLYHECLHIKHPNKPESWISNKTNEVVPVLEEL